jgi:hypothetical protein
MIKDARPIMARPANRATIIIKFKILDKWRRRLRVIENQPDAKLDRGCARPGIGVFSYYSDRDAAES